MVEIREIAPPAKVSGLSSFLARFQFRQDLVDAVKAIPGAYYHKKLQTWEIPANRLAEALDSLTFLDDIQLTLLSEEDEIDPISDNITEEEIRRLKFKPFAHQIDAINFGLQKKHKKWLLLDSMGLG